MSNKAGQTSPEGEDSKIAKMLKLGTKIGEGEQSTPAPNQPTPGSVQNLVPPGPTEPPDTTEQVPPGPTVPPDPTDQAAARAGTSRDSQASRAAPARPATQHGSVKNNSERDVDLPNDKKSLAKEPVWQQAGPASRRTGSREQCRCQPAARPEVREQCQCQQGAFRGEGQVSYITSTTYKL